MEDIYGLTELLSNLDEKRDEDVIVASYSGAACSRSSDSLHLATEAGVVAIPIKNIRRVDAISTDDPRVVKVEVRDPGSVQFLAKISNKSRALLQDKRSVLRQTEQLSPRPDADRPRFPSVTLGETAQRGLYTHTKSNGVSDDCLDWLPDDIIIVTP